MKIATFTEGHGIYYPANKEATAMCAILSKMRLTYPDLVAGRALGYDTRLVNGTEIGRVTQWA